MKVFKPHEFQEENVRWVCARVQEGKLHAFILDEMGLGKSVTAILCAKAFSVRRMLVVTKGMVRPSWLERFKEWWPERAGDVSSISEGAVRKGRSKPAEIRIRAAYTAPIQIVSNDLLSEVDQTGWDMLVFDEIHEHVSYRSSVSSNMRTLLESNPAAVVLGLTGTFVPAEPMNAWNMLHTFWPETWGKPSRSGDPPWKFKQDYCDSEPSEYAESGIRHFGLNKERAAEFAARIALVSRRTLRSDVAHLLPPLDVSVLLIEAKNKKTDLQLAIEWADTAIKESSHVQIFTYRRESAEALAGALQQLPRYRDVKVRFTHGGSSPENRANLLRELSAAPRALLVGTMDSLGTGISLTDFKQYLIIEATTEANQLAQAIGRFSRLDGNKTEPSRGFILLREGKDDDLVATLVRRIGDTNTLIKNGQAEVSLGTSLKSTKTPESFQRKLDSLLDSFTGYMEDSDE